MFVKSIILVHDKLLDVVTHGTWYIYPFIGL